METFFVDYMSICVPLLFLSAVPAGCAYTGNLENRETDSGMIAPTRTRHISSTHEVSNTGQLSLLTPDTVTVVVFVSPYCRTCFRMLQDLDRVLNRYSKINLEIFGVVIEATKKQADELAQRKHISFSLREDPDNETAAKFNIAAVPTVIVLGRNGQLLFRSTGKDSDMRNITTIIREAVDGR